MKETLEKIRSIMSPGREAVLPDSAITDVFKNPIFKQILNFTNQVFVVINETNSKYEYISDNASILFGYSTDFLKVEGMGFFLTRFHPLDIQYMVDTILPEFNRQLEHLKDEERLQTRLSYDYRVRKSDNSFTRVLQHNIPLALLDGKVSLDMAVLTDISAYKKEDYSSYQMVLYSKNGKSRILATGSSNQKTKAPEFSVREKEVLRMVSEGMTEKQIASKLNLSIQTVKTHKKNMLKSLGFRNSVDLVRFALANMII